jgi:hypothetical protein
MAIFKRRIFYFHMLEGFYFAAFFFFHVATLCTFSICVLFLCCFPSLFLLFPCVCVCLLALSLLVPEDRGDMSFENVP